MARLIWNASAGARLLGSRFVYSSVLSIGTGEHHVLAAFLLPWHVPDRPQLQQGFPSTVAAPPWLVLAAG